MVCATVALLIPKILKCKLFGGAIWILILILMIYYIYISEQNPNNSYSYPRKICQEHLKGSSSKSPMKSFTKIFEVP
jgi:hypothetical protein